MEMLYHYYYGSTAVLNTTISASTTWYAQSITTPTAAYPVSKIRMYLKRTGDVGTVTVAIRAVTAGKPSGADLATATVASAGIGTVSGWVDFNFASPYTLPADTPMAFLIRASLAGGTLSVADNDDAPFMENAFAYSSTNSGSTWSYIDPTDYSETFLFQIWGEDADAVQYLWASVGRNEPWGTNYVVAPMYYNGLVTTLGPGVITVAAGNGNGIALSEDKTRIFVGNGTAVRAFNSAYAVDTSWGTAGVFTVGVQIYGINVNSAGQLLVTHAETGSSETVSLINAAGTGYVWRKKPNPAVPIDLPWSKALAGDGNVVIGINDNDGGSFDVNYRLSITDGSVLNSWRNETVFYKAARGICSNADGSVIYAVFDDTMSATYSEAYRYVPATSVTSWTTPLTMRYAHGIILHSNGHLYVAAGTVVDGTIFQLDEASGGIENSVLITSAAFAGSIWEMVDGNLLVFSTAASVTDVEVFDENLVSLHFNSFPTGASGLQLFLTDTAPVITDQSTDTDIQVGDPLSLFVTATGTEPLGYQWYKGVDLLPDEISSTFVKDPAALEDAGTYTCQVSNTGGIQTSDDIVVSVALVPPVILTQSSDQVIARFSELHLYVTVSGSPPLSYQWYKDDSLIPDATDSTYTVIDVVGADCGIYTCRVTNTA